MIERVTRIILFTMMFTAMIMSACAKSESKQVKVSLNTGEAKLPEHCIEEITISGATIDDAFENLRKHAEDDESGGIYATVAEIIASQDISVYIPNAEISEFEICASFRRNDDEEVTASDIKLSFALSFSYDEKEYLMSQYTDGDSPSLFRFENAYEEEKIFDGTVVEFIGFQTESGENRIAYFTVEQDNWYVVFWAVNENGKGILADEEYFDSLSHGFFKMKEVDLKQCEGEPVALELFGDTVKALAENINAFEFGSHEFKQQLISVLEDEKTYIYEPNVSSEIMGYFVRVLPHEGEAVFHSGDSIVVVIGCKFKFDDNEYCLSAQYGGEEYEYNLSETLYGKNIAYKINTVYEDNCEKRMVKKLGIESDGVNVCVDFVSFDEIPYEDIKLFPKKFFEINKLNIPI